MANTSSLNVALPSYYPHPQGLATNNTISDQVDKIWRDGLQAKFLVNNGAPIDVSNFERNEIVSVWNWDIGDAYDYDPNADNPLGEARRINAGLFSYKVVQRLSFNYQVDALNVQDSAALRRIGEWVDYQIKNSINPPTDKNIFGTIVAHITDNSYTTSYTRSSDSAYQACVDAHTEVKKRTDLAASMICLVTTPTGMARLKKDAKFVRDNFVSQRQQIYEGSVGMVDGMPVYEVSEDRFGTTYDYIAIEKSITAFANPYRMLRYNQRPANRHGQTIDFLVKFDTIVTPNRGAACQGVSGS